VSGRRLAGVWKRRVMVRSWFGHGRVRRDYRSGSWRFDRRAPKAEGSLGSAEYRDPVGTPRADWRSTDNNADTPSRIRPSREAGRGRPLEEGEG
jgi:hypothetical protein